MNSKKEYDMAMLGKNLTGLSLRVVISGYIVYLAWKILSGSLDGTSPIPEWGSWLIFAAFTAAAVAFCAFAVRKYLDARKAAALPVVSQKDGKAVTFEAKEKDETEN